MNGRFEWRIILGMKREKEEKREERIVAREVSNRTPAVHLNIVELLGSSRR